MYQSTNLPSSNTWIYLSPHFDDAVFSCGGLIWEQTSRGDDVQIWTICAGETSDRVLSAYAQAHHQRWETGRDAVAQRRLEDVRACERVGATYRYFPIPDCIYRRSGENYWDLHPGETPGSAQTGENLYTSDSAIFGSIHPAENGLIEQLGDALCKSVPVDAELICPLVIGGHVDHRLTRAAAETLGRPLWYYADFPYVLKRSIDLDELSSQIWAYRLFEVTARGLDAWYEAAATYESQISTFWRDRLALRESLETYWEQLGGLRLYRPLQ
jgi:LmbE family N-acetylglucosaminyl deacetylase